MKEFNLFVVKEEEKPSERIGKEEHHGMTWICPRCGTRFWGWSRSNVCSNCGYKE